MRLLILAPVLALALLGVSSALPAAAAPDNKNTETFPVECEGLGEVMVTEVARGGENENARGGVGFTDGQVLVVKGFSGEVEITFAISGGPTFGPFTDSFEQAVPGKGFQGRLIECSFTEEFTDAHTLNEEDIAFLEAEFGLELDEFLGDTLTASGTFTGTAHVLTPPSN